MNATAESYRSSKVEGRTAVREGDNLTIFQGGSIIAEVTLTDETPGQVWDIVHAAEVKPAEETVAIENIGRGDEVFIEFRMNDSFDRKGRLVAKGYLTGKWTKATSSSVKLQGADRFGPALYGFNTRNFPPRKASEGTMYRVRRSV